MARRRHHCLTKASSCLSALWELWEWEMHPFWLNYIYFFFFLIENSGTLSKLMKKQTGFVHYCLAHLLYLVEQVFLYWQLNGILYWRFLCSVSLVSGKLFTSFWGRHLPLPRCSSQVLLLPPWSTSFDPNIRSPGEVQASPPRLQFSRQCLKEQNIHLERHTVKDIINYTTERSDNEVPL